MRNSELAENGIPPPQPQSIQVTQSRSLIQSSINILDGRQPECVIADVNKTIEQFSKREESLAQELQACKKLVEQYREENYNLQIKIEHLEAQIAKDTHNRSTNQQELDLQSNSQLLVPDQAQDNFGIGDEEESINIGKSSTNLQLKESFNILRNSIEKIFNEEDITLSVVRLLPRQLEDDFLDFVSYVKEKLNQIKNQNNLTFIAASNGEEPSIQEIEAELHEFLAMSSTECGQLKKIIEEKDCTINSLMNQKTEQENTINEHQTAQEQTQRLYMQQFSVLKVEIAQLKKTIDTQTVYYESIRNIFKKMMNLWLDDEDNFDDFEDNLKLITTIYKFSQRQMELIQKYLMKYKKLKNIS